jgi:CRISPR/Cas system-associated endoribonuclease Cas2
MEDDKRIKAQALHFARTFQTCIRTTVTFGINHPPAALQMQQTYDALNAVLKQFGQFTVGFVDQRVLLNKVLTTEKGLHPLENEFGKRNIGAIQFDIGITLADFRRCVEVISVSPAVIAEEGGLAAYLYTREIGKVRIIPAPKGQHRTETGDIIVETDVDSLLASRNAPKVGSLAGTDLLELMLRSGIDAPAGFDGTPQSTVDLMRASVRGTLVGGAGDPQKSYQTIGRMLQELSPEFVLSAFPLEKHERIKNLSPDQVAAEFMEDTAIQWAIKQLVSIPGASDAFVVEKEVISVLLRCLKATQTAERLAWKIEELFREYYLPMGTYERIKSELEWYQLPLRRRQGELSRIHRFNLFTSRRLLDLAKELVEQGITNGAQQVSQHFFLTLSEADDTLQPEEVAWAQQLLATVAGIPVAVHYGIDVLMQALASEYLAAIHPSIATALAATAQTTSVYEDYESVMMIGSALEAQVATNPEAHANCCGIHVRHLLTPNSIERVIEIAIERRNDPAWLKTATRLWNYGGPLSVESLLDRLENENDAKIRLFLIRHLSNMAHGRELVRQRLHDERWYVVRNACVVLAEMKDPELLTELAPLLRHSHDRVQESVFQSIVRSRKPERAMILAESLTSLRGRLLEQALDEILFLKDPRTVPSLKLFIETQKPGSQQQKAFQSLAAIPGDATVHAMADILGDIRYDIATRRAAMNAMLRLTNPLAHELVARFAVTAWKDPLGPEAQKAKNVPAR